MVADPPTFLGRGVTVVGRDTHAGDGPGLHPGALVSGQRLGRGQVEDGRPPTGRCVEPLEHGTQAGDEVSAGLATRRAGGEHHVVAGPGQVHRLALV